jgi:hypothetical protein
MILQLIETVPIIIFCSFIFAIIFISNREWFRLGALIGAIIAAEMFWFGYLRDEVIKGLEMKGAIQSSKPTRESLSWSDTATKETSTAWGEEPKQEVNIDLSIVINSW